ncbi:chromosomal replication initiator protein DnaA [Microgenomates group bacterium]|nr:chromosomal replication initiator protein DnaA [Microgenomates group bacterium]
MGGEKDKIVVGGEREIDAQDLWEEVKKRLKKEVTVMVFKTWTASIQLTKLEKNVNKKVWVATFVSPSSFHAIKFESLLGEKIKRIIKELTALEVELGFKTGQVASADLKKKRKETEVLDSLFSAENMASMQVNQETARAKSSGLQTNYVFTNFAVSDTNNLAFAAAQAVASNPGISYNPLFIYGVPGAGKTHLMNAIGNSILKNHPEDKVLYCTSEDFSNDYVNSIRENRPSTLRNKYRSLQALLVDDIQFIANKDKTQEEFFNTFNALMKESCQIIITADKNPREIYGLEERLVSRFEAGLQVDIQQPSFELRSAIVLLKANEAGLSLTTDLAQLIAAKADNARKIIGIVNKLQLAINLGKKELTMELVNDVLRSEMLGNKALLMRKNPIDILRCVSDYFGVKPAAVRGQRRMREIVVPRHITMFLMKTELNFTYVEIGKWFGTKDHTTAMHGIKRVNERLASGDEEMSGWVEELKIKLVSS